MALCYAASLRQKVDGENPFDSVLSVEMTLKALDEVFLKKKASSQVTPSFFTSSPSLALRWFSLRGSTALGVGHC